jgi:4-diphosphocytidyl-2-C-methyl-D-erythritol kinase
MTGPAVITEQAPAKLNLYLHVLGRRADGYHELDSLVAFADIADTVSVRPAEGLSLTIDGPFAASLAAEPASDNLVSRAARLLAERFGRPDPGVAITLTKRLPVASGIGGGSADAAATLRALARLWEIGPDEPPLHQLLHPVAARLGADVPVCLTGRPAYFGGVGDIIDPAPPLPPCAVVLVNPSIPLATPSVFRARTGPFSTAARFDDGAPPADAVAFAQLLAARHNDLTAPARSLVPEIGTVLDALSATDGCLLARLSGSGATCFALYADPAQAHAAAVELGLAHAGWWIVPGRLSA